MCASGIFVHCSFVISLTVRLTRSVKDRVEGIQDCMLATMRRVHEYLLQWKNFRNLWLYSKERTCRK